jgi:hypothetical protein
MKAFVRLICIFATKAVKEYLSNMILSASTPFWLTAGWDAIDVGYLGNNINDFEWFVQ